MDAGSWRWPGHRRAGRRVRGPPRVMDAGRNGPDARLSRHRTSPRRPREVTELHACRVAPGDGASVLRVVGLPDDGVLRAHQPIWRAAGPDGADRPAAWRGRRRDPGLGTVAFRLGRARAGVLRRNAPVRARRPSSGISSGLGELHLQLRPERGALLPAFERDALARAIPRGRSPRGRRRVDALPRLLAARGRVDTERARWAREPPGG